MSLFNTWTSHVLRWEGGYVNDPADSGGETNRGVTWEYFQEVARPALGISPSKSAFLQLQPVQVMQILSHFWNTSEAYKINDQALAVSYADAAWHSGKYTATWHLQQAINQAGSRIGIDGDFGGETERGANQVGGKALPAFLAIREDFYRRLAVSRPKDQKFLKGWLNRLNSLKSWVLPEDAATVGGMAAGGLLLLIYLMLKK